jgi:hypothetical protein
MLQMALRFIFVRLKYLYTAFLLVGFGPRLHAQYGGNGVFSVLKMPANATTAAWGGYSTAFRMGDPTFMINNPALLGDASHNMAAMNFNTHVPGVWSGSGAYAMKYKDLGYFGASVSFIDYGTMDAYDAGGNAEGQVSANETSLSLSFSRPYNKQISYGVSVKMAYSILAGYVANGVGLDAGVVYTSADSVFSAGLVFRNAGFMIQHYRDAEREKFPFQAELGINFKPRHMPFRFNIVAHDLQKPDLTYSQYLSGSGNLDLNGDPVTPQPASFGDKVMRHFTIGTELVLGKNFGILFGYNHQRRKEMGPDALRKVTGFSWGLHFKISKIHISYSSAAYFPGYNMNLFTFGVRLSDFQKKSATSQPKK